MTDDPYIGSIDVSMLQGGINVCTIEVHSSLGDGTHTLRYMLPSTGKSAGEIKRVGHTTPYGDNMNRGTDEYAEDLAAVRKRALEELSTRNLDRPEEWRNPDD